MKKLSGKYITVPLVRRVIGMPGHASSAFNACVGHKVAAVGGTGKTRYEIRDIFKAAAQSCKGTRNK